MCRQSQAELRLREPERQRRLNNARNRRFASMNPEKRRDAKLRGRYGITQAQFKELVARQSGACAVCRESFSDSKAAHVDHCHVSRKVRGVLCRGCNIGLGAFADSPERMEAAAEYLRRSRK